MTEADRFVAACRETICREMPGLLDELFSKLDDVLYNLADKSETNKLYTTYYDAMRVFRQRRWEIHSMLLRNLLENGHIEASARQQTDTRSESGTSDAHDIEFVAEAELEETLAVANLISKAENRYQRELLERRRRLASLRGQASIESRTDPLGPHRICNAFRQALSLVDDVGLAIKLVVYKLFDRQVMDQLGPIYARCCECASGQTRARGMLPACLATPGSKEQGLEGASRAVADAAGRDSGEMGVHARESSGADRAVAFHDLQRLLIRRRQDGASDGDLVVLDTNELLSALSRLQESSESEADSRELRRRLSDYLHLGGGGISSRALGRIDEDTLDLVFLLFEHILHGNDIPDPLKVLIGRLQIPILKVTLVDKSFFEDKHHPARRLLNHLAQVAVGWNDDGDRSPAGVYGRIAWVVEQIVVQDERDPAIFAKLDAKLCNLLIREQEQAQPQEVGAHQDPDLRERQHTARQFVKMAINQRLRGRGPLPDGVRSLLFEGWQTVLLAAYLRDGIGGDQWHNAMRIIDRLVWSVQPKVAYEDRRELLRSIPELLRTLRESLAEVSYDQRRLARWFKELQALHITALRGTGSALVKSGQEVEPAQAPTGHAPGDRVNNADRWGSRKGKNAPASEVPGLETGAWIEVRRDDGGLIRVKLAWRSPQSGIYLFVDRRGHKVLELTGEDILKLERQGTLTVLGDTPIIDRAMQELVLTLKSDRGL